MQLKKIKIKDFMIHRNLSENLEGAILGLFGDNGTGKSCFLTAISFALTGVLKKNHNEYINRASLHTEKRPAASVELEFLVKGRKCVVTRRITPTTTSHKLEAEGLEKPLTKLRDVDEFMDGVFNANKKAISEATFIEQGDLEDVFQGERAEREDFIGRLLQVTHLEKVGKAVTKKIQQMDAGLEDFTISRDTLVQDLGEAQKGRDEIQTQVSRFPDYSGSLEIATLVRDLDDDTDTAENALNRSKAEQLSLQERLSADLSRAGIKNLEEMEALKKELKSVREKIQELQPDMDRHTLYFQTFRRHQQLYSDIKSVEQEISEVETPENAGGALSDKATKLEAAVNHMTRIAELKKELGGIQERIDENTKKIEELPTPEEIEEAGKKVSDLAELIWAKEMRLEMVEKLEAGTAHTEHCPICESSLDGDKLGHKPAAEIRKEIEDLKAQKKTAWNVASSESSLRAAESHVREATDLQSKTTMELLELRSHVSGMGTIDEVKEELSDVESRIERSRLNAERIQRLQSKLEDLRKAEELIDDDENKLASSYDEEAYNRIETSMSTARTKESNLSNSISIAEGAKESIEENRNTIRLREEALEKAREARRKLADKEGYEDVMSRIKSLGDVNQAIAWYQAEMDKLNQLKGSLRTSQGEVDRIRVRLSDIERRIKESGIKRKVLDDLRKLESAFKRDGIGSRYIAYKFQQLAALTQNNLEKLEPNFCVEADQHVPVSFLFTRTDDEYGDAMPQHMLSGGQRIRLSLAFLNAVQQLIVSEVGLLCVDEPSNHLDPNGVQQVRDFFMGLSQALDAHECQLIISDHDLVLADSVTRAIRF